MGRALLALTLVPLLATGPALAQPPPGTAPDGADAAPILCEWSHAVFAWQARLAFRGIAADGRVLEWASSEAEGPQGRELLALRLSDRPGEGEFARRYSLARPTGEIVPPEMLARIAALVREVRDGAVERQRRGFDMGQAGVSCFLPAGDGVFEPVMLFSGGDLEIRNTHPGVPELTALLGTYLRDPTIPAP